MTGHEERKNCKTQNSKKNKTNLKIKIKNNLQQNQYNIFFVGGINLSF